MGFKAVADFDFDTIHSSIAFGNNLFVASLNISPDQAQIRTSHDGINWTARQVEGGEIRDIAYSNGIFTASGLTHALASLDGINWQCSQAPWANNFRTIIVFMTYINGLFMASGWNNVIVTL